MTDKLYEEDAYLREFEAEVTGCVPAEGGWLVTLDRTAFYPEGGGQPADTGTLGGARVLDVHEQEGEILHTTDAPLPVGDRTAGAIDWEARFSRMQQHTGEHIVSGVIHRLFGLDNVGFHMGRDAVTIDLNGELTADDLTRVERLANEAVWENLPVGVEYPAPEALAALDYRSKKELTGRVRIVTVPGSDVCACCGTHVRRTGEIGVIKLLTSQRYKGGVRVWLLCGDRALTDYNEKNAQAYAVSGDALRQGRGARRGGGADAGGKRRAEAARRASSGGALPLPRPRGRGGRDLRPPLRGRDGAARAAAVLPRAL